ncbi:hypothetical protein [Fulvivirga ligni]|uniref:hypothetical protein n=1 Tax=Fulvivirga ligni TaxID=2904246 RepID=UPI001F15B655|nr:hypothetical protein [Fulvivirga ligni]UII23469.1 hypothetical protein LVD16_09540 [Fulvivirga ligni]
MFVTILTIIYSAIALFVLGRYIKKKASKITEFKNRAALKYQSAVAYKRNWGKNKEVKEPRVELQPEV